MKSQALKKVTSYGRRKILILVAMGQDCDSQSVWIGMLEKHSLYVHSLHVHRLPIVDLSAL